MKKLRCLGIVVAIIIVLPFLVEAADGWWQSSEWRWAYSQFDKKISN